MEKTLSVASREREEQQNYGSINGMDVIRDGKKEHC